MTDETRTPAQVFEDTCKYGLCEVCGTVRTTVVTDVPGGMMLEMICPAGCLLVEDVTR